jgi:hypothetical protein
MEKNNSDFVVDPKRDFVRKSELSFSKTMKFILGMGSRSLGSELMEFWGIETSFRELKYHVGLIAFHSKKKDCVIQEIFASLIMYNFSMLITENIVIDEDKHNDYHYKINYAVAIHACIKFFRSSHADPSLLEDLIARNKCPVRPDRIAVRKTRCHSAIGFNYRLS